jgi:hypothetical protein
MKTIESFNIQALVVKKFKAPRDVDNFKPNSPNTPTKRVRGGTANFEIWPRLTNKAKTEPISRPVPVTKNGGKLPRIEPMGAKVAQSTMASNAALSEREITCLSLVR